MRPHHDLVHCPGACVVGERSAEDPPPRADPSPRDGPLFACHLLLATSTIERTQQVNYPCHLRGNDHRFHGCIFFEEKMVYAIIRSVMEINLLWSNLCTTTDIRSFVFLTAIDVTSRFFHHATRYNTPHHST